MLSKEIEKKVAELLEAVRVEAFDAGYAARSNELEAMFFGGGKTRAPAPGRAPSLAAGSMRPAAGGRRSTEQLEEIIKTLRSYVKKNPGQRIEQIATALKLDTKSLTRPMAKLLEAKEVKKKGQRRATTYTAVA